MEEPLAEQAQEDRVSAHQSADAERLVIRDLDSIDDLAQLRAVEREVWGMADEDALPLTLAIASRAAGNLFIGAFGQSDPPTGTPPDNINAKLVGFAFGFLGREHGHPTIHSHMLAVVPAYRHLDLGKRLKMAQRDRALAMGIQEMTWTFDPLQSRNAHFNFSKLGVISDSYKVDFYGPQTSSALHQNGTDRLWVRWLLNSTRVRDHDPDGGGRASPTACRAQTQDALRLLTPLVHFDLGGRPVRGNRAEALARQRLSIEIPGEILEVERADMNLAREWRQATRWAFQEALKAGFRITEFARSIRGQQGPGAYLLERAD